jgi:nitroimidazol reductase NimA-like FMN-containing flavoprotein (pyridoxamine 5'-phosphate oxidase superfamily)
VNTTKTLLVSLDEARCADLVAESALGRLAVIINGRPEIFPVNHVYGRASNSIVFPVHDGAKLRGALDWPWVAFEVDDIDVEHNCGWSVAVVGAAEEIVDAETTARLSSERHVLWGEGSGARWIRIAASKMTGREIRAYE